MDHQLPETKKVDYVMCTFLHSGDSLKRSGSPAAVNLVEYVIDDLLRDGFDVSVISPSWSLEEKGFSKGKVRRVSDRLTYRFFSTFGSKHVQLQHLWSIIQLSLYLLFRGSSTLIAYHSGNDVRYALAFWRLSHPHGTLILQVGEVYADVFHRPQKERARELAFFTKAQRYIFASQGLEKLINGSHKPFVIIQGTYRGEKQWEEKKDREKIHVVYAGTLNPEKGASFAVASAEFLPSSYEIHILGNDDPGELERMKVQVGEMDRRNPHHAAVVFEGVLLGERYVRFLQQCDIGLVPQKKEADFNSTSFPSKIFSYLANGLHVISTRIPVIEHSSVGKQLSYYDGQNPKDLSASIMAIDVKKPYDGRVILEDLHKEALESLKNLLQ